jgi:hypothetical protein
LRGAPAAALKGWSPWQWTGATVERVNRGIFDRRDNLGMRGGESRRMDQDAPEQGMMWIECGKNVSADSERSSKLIQSFASATEKIPL